MYECCEQFGFGINLFSVKMHVQQSMNLVLCEAIYRYTNNGINIQHMR